MLEPITKIDLQGFLTNFFSRQGALRRPYRRASGQEQQRSMEEKGVGERPKGVFVMGS